MKRKLVWLCLLCLLLCGCAGQPTVTEPTEETQEAIPMPDIEQRLADFYPHAEIEKITEGDQTFWQVSCETDLEDYDEIQYSGMSGNYKYISSLEALRKNDERHYSIVKGYRVGPSRQTVWFTESGAVNRCGSFFTVRVTEVCHHKTDMAEIGAEIVLRNGTYVLLPHGEKRVLHKSHVELPKENEEYFFIVDWTSDGKYSYYNPLASDLRIDESLKTAKKLTQAQKLTLDLMEEYP